MAMDNSLHYSIVTDCEALEVVRRMISGEQQGAASAQEMLDVFLRFASRYKIDVSRQAVARLNDQIVGYCLCLVNPGATASIFLPERFCELRSPYSFQEVAVEVLRTLASQIEAWNLAIMQAMVVDETSIVAEVFRRAGFQDLCRLEIMESPVDTKEPSAARTDLEWVRFESHREEQFASTILQTYEGSQDAPRLTGLRTGREILAGHENSGIFEPEGWWMLRYQGRDAGVILLNSTEEDPDRAELIYMGLVPWAREKGLGNELLGYGFRVAGNLGKKVFRLSVDCANQPAIRLYRKFGFRTVGQQTVLAVLNEKRRTRATDH